MHSLDSRDAEPRLGAHEERLALDTYARTCQDCDGPPLMAACNAQRVVPCGQCRTDIETRLVRHCIVRHGTVSNACQLRNSLEAVSNAIETIGAFTSCQFGVIPTKVIRDN